MIWNSYNVTIGKINNLNLEGLTKENSVKYVKAQNSILKKINIKEGDYIDDLNTTKFIKKSGFNSYYEDIYAFLISKEKALDLKTNKIDWNKVIYIRHILIF